ncbi:MAG TPA: tRNA (adenosine(37)-N6)-dimethylallyltransferase MiaA [Gemmataceae bacterium]|nr:tRNA (adenosine(37)-N6)-dimethylallyltransferase MiaA [Gemmataceae bacterium]
MILDEYPQGLILTGPTGSGKSRLALDLAERLEAEIVSMDSMALYRHMDIGTAKPTAEDRRCVPHHLLDVLEPWESANVAWWLERAGDCCRDISARGKRPLFVGGTPLYLKALLYGLFDGPPADETIRRRLSEEAAAIGAAALHDRLATVDPVSAARLHPNDMRRVIRALEVWELTGRPISEWQTQWKRVEGGEWRVEGKDVPPPSTLHPPRCLCLDLPRSELYARIDARVERMIAEGLVEEVRALRRLERPLSREAAQALGYKEMIAYLDGQADLIQTIQHIQRRSRQFAKRQMTWFRHLNSCRMVRAELTFAAWGLTMQ